MQKKIQDENKHAKTKMDSSYKHSHIQKDQAKGSTKLTTNRMLWV
jgi:hypothetical protein